MSHEITPLAFANATIADAAQRDVITVEIERVRTADAAEYSGGGTVREIVTNHQITRTDKVGMYRAPGWHGLGTVIDEGLSGEDAVRRYLDWSVERVQSYVDIDGVPTPIPVWAQVRSDTRQILGVVGPEYRIVQNIDMGRFADAIVGSDAAVTMETCGSLLGGRKVFLLIRVPREVRVGRTGEDVTVPYLLLANGHDGSMALSVQWTLVRVVCANTYTRALGAARGAAAEGTTFRIRHVGEIAAQLAEARRVLGIAAAGLTQYEEQAQALAAADRTPAPLRAAWCGLVRSGARAADTAGPRRTAQGAAPHEDGHAHSRRRAHRPRHGRPSPPHHPRGDGGHHP